MWKDRALEPKSVVPRAHDLTRPDEAGGGGAFTLPETPKQGNGNKETTKLPSCTRPHFYQTRLGPNSVTTDDIPSPSDFRSRGRASLGAATRGLHPLREESGLSLASRLPQPSGEVPGAGAGLPCSLGPAHTIPDQSRP